MVAVGERHIVGPVICTALTVAYYRCFGVSTDWRPLIVGQRIGETGIQGHVERCGLILGGLVARSARRDERADAFRKHGSADIADECVTLEER